MERLVFVVESRRYCCEFTWPFLFSILTIFIFNILRQNMWRIFLMGRPIPKTQQRPLRSV
jgi:hypothetical protein